MDMFSYTPFENGQICFRISNDTLPEDTKQNLRAQYGENYKIWDYIITIEVVMINNGVEVSLSHYRLEFDHEWDSANPLPDVLKFLDGQYVMIEHK